MTHLSLEDILIGASPNTGRVTINSNWDSIEDKVNDIIDIIPSGQNTELVDIDLEQTLTHKTISSEDNTLIITREDIDQPLFEIVTQAEPDTYNVSVNDEDIFQLFFKGNHGLYFYLDDSQINVDFADFVILNDVEQKFLFGNSSLAEGSTFPFDVSIGYFREHVRIGSHDTALDDDFLLHLFTGSADTAAILLESSGDSQIRFKKASNHWDIFYDVSDETLNFSKNDVQYMALDSDNERVIVSKDIEFQGNIIINSGSTISEAPENSVVENSIATGAVTNSKLAGGITADKLDGDIPAEKLGEIPTTQLSGVISWDQLNVQEGEEAVTTESIRDRAITAIKLGLEVIESGHFSSDLWNSLSSIGTLGEEAIDEEHLNHTDSTQAVSTRTIQDNAVTDLKLSSSEDDDDDRAVGTDHIKTSSITPQKIYNIFNEIETVDPATVLSPHLAETDLLISVIFKSDASHSCWLTIGEDINSVTNTVAQQFSASNKLASYMGFVQKGNYWKIGLGGGSIEKVNIAHIGYTE